MSKKITWNKIREDFKINYPKYHKEVDYWRPHDFATIILYFKDGRKATYNYDTKRMIILKGE